MFSYWLKSLIDLCFVFFQIAVSWSKNMSVSHIIGTLVLIFHIILINGKFFFLPMYQCGLFETIFVYKKCMLPCLIPTKKCMCSFNVERVYQVIYQMYTYVRYGFHSHDYQCSLINIIFFALGVRLFNGSFHKLNSKFILKNNVFFMILDQTFKFRLTWVLPRQQISCCVKLSKHIRNTNT